jgi:hypothetical protein
MKKIVVTFLMASGVALFSTMPMMSQTTVALSATEKSAQDDYFKALDALMSGKMANALKFVESAEKKLNKTNPRLSYLKAKIYNSQQEYLKTQQACQKYFSFNPIKDDGYEEMTTILDEVTKELQIISQKRAEEMEAQRVAAAEKSRLEAENARRKAELKRVAIERRAKDAEEQKVKDAEILKKFQAVQAKNTKEAYQQFIYDYPYGVCSDKAKQEMAKKWPVPTRVLKKNKYGYINKSGDMVVKAKYDYATDFREERARVGKAGKYGFVSIEGDEIIPMKYIAASNFNYGYAVVKTGEDEFFFIDKQGNKMSDIIYYDAKSFNEGLAAVQNEFYKYGFIDPSGNEAIPFVYDNVSWFSEGLAAVAKKEGGKVKYAYIDKSGKEITDFIYDEAKDFQGGVARVKQNDKYGLIDKFGSFIIECEYDFISEFGADGLAFSRRNGCDVYLDKEGTPWAKVKGNLVRVNF